MRKFISERLKHYESNPRAIGNIKWDIIHHFGDIGLEEIKTYGGKNLIESVFRYIHQISDIEMCEYCKTHPKRFLSAYLGYDQTCSKLCKNKLIYGVDNPAKAECVKSKMRQTNEKKFGGPTPLYSKDVLDKIKKTSIEKYGVEHHSKTGKHMSTYRQNTGFKCPLSNPNVRKKITETNTDKYGGKSPMANIEIRKKVSTSRLGKTYPKIRSGKKISFYRRVKQYYADIIEFQFSESEYVGSHIGTEYTRYKFRCLRCKSTFDDFFDHSGIKCPNCDKTPASKPQNEVIKYLNEIGVITQVNTKKIIPPFELDIYIPELKLAIEFDGLLWHSETFGEKSRRYHAIKTGLCNEIGIRLIHIFEDEWNESKEIVKSRLAHAVGKFSKKIHARKCNILEISSDQKRQFLNSNHIQGDCKSSYNVGAFFNSELVAVMTFGKRRFDKKSGYELLRFATAKDTNICGIASKLLSFAERHYIDDTISYCDLRWGTGAVYHKLGFTKVRVTPPNYFYIKRTKRLHRQQFQKHKLKNVLPIYDPNLSEWDNMQANGYDRIWDCGSILFEKQKRTT
jgi:DNA-directed RNA polymerase subunit RPC12/RpoP/very-short-patch-repair endonuclease